MGQRESSENSNFRRNVKKADRLLDKIASLEAKIRNLVDEGEYNEAEKKLQKHLEILREIHGKRSSNPEIAKSLTKLGHVYDKLGNKRKSLHYLEKALSVWRQIHGDYLSKPDTRIADLLTDLCRTWRKVCDYEKAVDYGKESVTMKEMIFKQHRNSKTCLSLASTYYYLARSYCHEDGDYAKAFDSLQQASSYIDDISQHSRYSRTLKDDTPLIRFKAKIYRQMAKTYEEKGDYVCALDYVKMAFELSKIVHGANSGHRDMVVILSTMVSIENKLKNVRIQQQRAQAMKRLQEKENKNNELESDEKLPAEVPAGSIEHSVEGPAGNAITTVQVQIEHNDQS